MRSTILFLLVLLGTAVTTFGQERIEVEVEDEVKYIPPSLKDVQQFTVELTVFRPTNKQDANLPLEKLKQRIEQAEKEGGEGVVETIRLSASDNVESSIQIGSNIAQPRETNFNGRGSSRSYERKNVGTLVNVTPHGQGDKVALQIRYESSRFGKSPTEDAPADILTATWNATLVVEPGKPTLVGSISSDKSTLLIVNVHK